MAAENPYVNKVIYGTTVLVDLTDTTALAADVAEGKVFYGADGSRIVGTAKGGGSMTKLWENSSPTSSFAAQSVTLSDEWTNYDLILISYIFSTGTQDYATLLVPVEQAENRSWAMRVGAGSNNRNGGRPVDFDKIWGTSLYRSLNFGAATYNGSTSNGYVIPAAVYGIKL